MLTPKIITQSDSEAEFEVKLDTEYIAPHKSHVLSHLKRDLKVSGFRPGKAPDNIVERELGDQRVQTEVLQDIIMHSYGEAVQQLKLETVADPEITMQTFVPYSELSYKATVAVAPKITLPDLTKLDVKEEKVEVSDKELDEAIGQLRKSAAKRTPVKRAVKSGDEVKLDFEGTREGKPVEGAAAQNQTLTVGAGQFIPGFEDNLIGLKSGGEKTFTVTFPKDYRPADLAGAKVDFKVKLHEVNEVSLPELTDALAKKLGPFENLDQLRKDVRAYLIQGKTEEAQRHYRNAVLDKLLEKTKVPVAAKLVDAQAKAIRDELNHELSHRGLDEEKYLQLNNKQKQEHEREIRTDAERRVKLALLLRTVITANHITVSPQELDAQFEALRGQYAEPEAQSEMDKPNFRSDLANRMLTEKTIDFIVNQTKGGKP